MGKQHPFGTLNPGMSRNLTKNDSGGRTDTDKNAEIGIMIEDGMTMTETTMTNAKTTITEIDMSATTPRSTTTDGTRHDRVTGIIDATIEEDIFAGTSIGRQPENTTGDWIQTQLWHHWNNERRKTTTE